MPRLEDILRNLANSVSENHTRNTLRLLSQLDNCDLLAIRAKREQILNFLERQDDEGFTLGHIIACRQKNKSIQEYLNLIQVILEKDKTHAVQIIRLLKKQDQQNVTLAHRITITTQNEPATLQYLTLLNSLLDKDISNYPLILELLKLHTESQWNLSQMILYYQRTIVAKLFLTLLKKLVRNQADANTILEILKLQNQAGFSSGHLLTRYSKENIVKIFFELLEHLLSHGATSKSILEFLQLGCIKQWTIAHIIAHYQDDSSCMKEYINLLQKLTDRGTVNHVYDLLLLKDNRGLTSLKLILNNQRKSEIKTYLALLENLLTKGLDPRKVILLLQKTSDGRFTLGHLIANDSIEEILVKYLNLLSSLVNRSLTQQVIFLLAQQDFQDFSFGHCLTSNKKYYKNALEVYLQLLKRLIEKAPKQAIKLLETVDQRRLTIGHILIFRGYPTQNLLKYLDLLYQLKAKGISISRIICSLENPVSKTSFLQQLAFFYSKSTSLVVNYLELLCSLREELQQRILPTDNDNIEKSFYQIDKLKIFEHIKTLEINRQKKLLILALNQNTALGKLFWQQRGILPTSLERGTLHKIIVYCREQRFTDVLSTIKPDPPSIFNFFGLFANRNESTMEVASNVELQTPTATR